MVQLPTVIPRRRSEVNMSRNPVSLHGMSAAAFVAMFLVTDVRLLGDVPSPVPPQYDRLKNLHPAISLVTNGQPAVAIVVPASGLYSDAAAAVQGGIEKRTGVQVPIMVDNGCRSRHTHPE